MKSFRAKHALGLEPGVDAGSRKMRQNKSWLDDNSFRRSFFGNWAVNRRCSGQLASEMPTFRHRA